MKKLLFIFCLTFGSIQANILLKIVSYPLYLAKLDDKCDVELSNCCTIHVGPENMCSNCKEINTGQKKLQAFMEKVGKVQIVIGTGILIYTAIKIKQNPKKLRPDKFLTELIKQKY